MPSDPHPTDEQRPRAWVSAAILEGLARRGSTSPDVAHALREAGKMLVEMERELEALRHGKR